MSTQAQATEAGTTARREQGSQPRLSAAARANGITPRMFGVLACAVATPGLSATEICRRLHVQKCAVSYATCTLERMGLLYHRTDPADLRRACIHATEAGTALLRKVVVMAVRPASLPAAEAAMVQHRESALTQSA